MSYREQDIVYENGHAWVLRKADRYVAMLSCSTHSVSDSAYPPTTDGLSLAKARCDYLAASRNPVHIRFSAEGLV